MATGTAAGCGRDGGTSRAGLGHRCGGGLCHFKLIKAMRPPKMEKISLARKTGLGSRNGQLSAIE
eukprot:1572940-Pleurochrysis_carterae.AAC.4